MATDLNERLLGHALYFEVWTSPGTAQDPSDEKLRAFLESQAHRALTDEEMFMILPVAVQHAYDSFRKYRDLPDSLVQLDVAIVLTRLMAFGNAILTEVMDRVAAG